MSVLWVQLCEKILSHDAHVNACIINILNLYLLQRCLERLLIKMKKRKISVSLEKKLIFSFISFHVEMAKDFWLSLLTINFFLLQMSMMWCWQSLRQRKNLMNAPSASNPTITEEISFVTWSMSAVSRRKSRVNTVHT